MSILNPYGAKEWQRVYRAHHCVTIFPPSQKVSNDVLEILNNCPKFNAKTYFTHADFPFFISHIEKVKSWDYISQGKKNFRSMTLKSLISGYLNFHMKISLKEHKHYYGACVSVLSQAKKKEYTSFEEINALIHHEADARKQKASEDIVGEVSSLTQYFTNLEYHQFLMDMNGYKNNKDYQFLGLRCRSFVKEYSHFFSLEQSLNLKQFSSIFLQNIREGRGEQFDNFSDFNTFLLQQYTIFIEAKNNVWNGLL